MQAKTFGPVGQVIVIAVLTIGVWQGAFRTIEWYALDSDKPTLQILALIGALIVGGTLTAAFRPWERS